MLVAGCAVIPRADAVSADMVTVVNPEAANAFSPIPVTELGIVIDVKLKHDSNALSPILATCEVGSNVTDDKLVHDSNASSPILVTELGMRIDVKLEHPWNAYRPILATCEVGSNVTDVKLVHK